MRALRSFYQISVYERNSYNGPSFFPDGCLYLSAKQRICGMNRAASFENVELARKFFDEWKKRDSYVMHIRESKWWIEIPDPIFPDNHPRSILENIRKNEKRHIERTAFMWFLGEKNYISDSTLKKHRNILLNYNIDIFEKPDQLLTPLESQDDNVWHLAPPKLKVI